MGCGGVRVTLSAKVRQLCLTYGDQHNDTPPTTPTHRTTQLHRYHRACTYSHHNLNRGGVGIMESQFKTVEIKTVKQGDTFKRKPSAAATFTRNHYNRKDAFGPASFSCTDVDDMNREIFLKPTTLVWVET